MFNSASHYKHIVSAAMASEDEAVPLVPAPVGMQMIQTYSDEKSTEIAGPSHEDPLGQQQSRLNLLLLPQEVQQNILCFLSYAELSRIRITCHGLKQVCGCVLNQGFQKIQARIQRRFQHIKSQMPRRESARRKHPLARECDIMETLHMRMALLHMTFGRRIERGHCCFFAGEVLDEVLRILEYVTNTTNIGRAYKVTDELFDLSTMAMEYFKEKIEPTFPEINTLSPDYIPIFSTPKARPFLEAMKPSSEKDNQKANTPSTSSPMLTPPVSSVSSQKIKTLNSEMRKVKRTVSTCVRKMSIQRSQLRDATSKLEQQDRKIEEQNRRIEALITELHQCQSDIRQVQTPRKDPTGLASPCVPSASKSAPVVDLDVGSSPSLSGQLSIGQKHDNIAVNSPPKRPLSPSLEEADSSTPSKKRRT